MLRLCLDTFLIRSSFRAKQFHMLIVHGDENGVVEGENTYVLLGLVPRLPVESTQ
jgi:hypothetical protein